LRKWRNPLGQGEVEIDWRIFTRLPAAILALDVNRSRAAGWVTTTEPKAPLERPDQSQVLPHPTELTADARFMTPPAVLMRGR
jgi:hypothetical protein